VSILDGAREIALMLAPKNVTDPLSAKDRPSITSTKLRTALEYLGDKLVTHRDSRFKPVSRFLLDEWRATRVSATGKNRRDS
jgi:hypothetical protein